MSGCLKSVLSLVLILSCEDSRRLPKWRHALRQNLLPIVRWETPYLARVQEICRTAFLDQYFAMTANLGTHTFFMTALPICFWCGYTENARA